MAIVEKFIASVEVGDSASKLASASIRVGAGDARAYVAAANQAARDATDVGILLLAALDVTEVQATNHYKKWSMQCDFVNDGFTYFAETDHIFNSNKLKVTYSTTNGGIPAKESLYIPMRYSSLTYNGVNVVMNDGAEMEAFLDALIANGLSSYGSAILDVLSVTVNDS